MPLYVIHRPGFEVRRSWAMKWGINVQAGTAEGVHGMCTGGRHGSHTPALARAAAGRSLPGAVHDWCAELLIPVLARSSKHINQELYSRLRNSASSHLLQNCFFNLDTPCASSLHSVFACLAFQCGTLLSLHAVWVKHLKCQRDVADRLCRV